MFSYIPDERIAILCGVYFILSIVMTIIINRLPVFSWTWASVWGIAWVNIGLVFFVWLPRGSLLHPMTVLIEEYLVFASSLPPLAVGEYKQHRQYRKCQRAQAIEDVACLVGMQSSILAKLDSIYACLTGKPVEDIQRNW